MAANNLQLQQSQLEKERQQALRQLRLLEREMADYGNNLKDRAATIRELTEEQLQAGEIDFFQYLQSLEAALQSELDFLDLEHRLSIAELQVAYLK